MSLYKGQNRNHLFKLSYIASIMHQGCQSVMFHFTGVRSFKSPPSLHVSLSICHVLTFKSGEKRETG